VRVVPIVRAVEMVVSFILVVGGEGGGCCVEGDEVEELCLFLLVGLYSAGRHRLDSEVGCSALTLLAKISGRRQQSSRRVVSRRGQWIG